VLVYHGLTERSPRRSLREVSVRAFRAQLAHLRRHYEVVALDELVSDPRGRVALTFDDDLRSHATVASPLLREAGLPATFFLTGGALEGPFRHWWHDLDAIDRAGTFAAATEALASDWPWVREAGRIRHLEQAIEALPPRQLDRLASRLRELAPAAAGDPGLQGPGIAELTEAGFGIGFHTLAHHSLQTLDDTSLAAAMADGRKQLEQAAGAPTQAIAYPYGRADARVAAAARAAGFRLGLTCGGGAVLASDPPLLLERLDPSGFGERDGLFALAFARTAAG
jgi:peptidoglycan/xylan/chitin deacetylase (PgdA/CDA1 family)